MEESRLITERKFLANTLVKLERPPQPELKESQDTLIVVESLEIPSQPTTESSDTLMHHQTLES